MKSHIFIVSTYGSTSYGFGHDTKTEGPIEAKARISTHRGSADFENLLSTFVRAEDIRRGDKIKVTIEKADESF